MTPLIYNLFPLLVGSAARWPEHAVRAAGMGFNWLYINPWHYPGFSGSLYAPKDFRRLHPLFAGGGDPGDLAILESALAGIRAAGLRPMMDLVINHTSRDAVLVDEHPEWYVRDGNGNLVSPSVTDPDDPARVTVWGDLAEIDNDPDAPHRRDLWQHWADLVRDSIRMGVQGFRCDAAYKVPAGLWAELIDTARAVDPGVQFFAETLGAPVEDVLALRDAGFHYIFNSSKWWDFRQPWALEQHTRFRGIAPSIGFPESHDTTRLAADTGGSEAVQRQRYAFAAAFSAGVMMPVGYEFGFRRQVNVVKTQPSDWERKSFDISSFIGRVNHLKRGHPALQGEGVLSAPTGLDGDVLVLERGPEEGAATAALVLLNRDPDVASDARLPNGSADGMRLFRVCRDDAPACGEAVPDRLALDPAEVVYVLPA